jgi:hypothetical protein
MSEEGRYRLPASLGGRSRLSRHVGAFPGSAKGYHHRYRFEDQPGIAVIIGTIEPLAEVPADPDSTS